MQTAAREGRQRLVAVIGGADTDPAAEAVAEALGRALAVRGLSVVCGGRSGVMAAVSRGLREARAAAAPGSPACGVLALGILPGVDDAEANPWLDVALPTGLGKARDAVLVRAAQAVIAVGGQAGTLGELALAWQFGKPICALTGCGGWSARVAGQALDARPRSPIHAAATAEEAAVWAARCLPGA